MAFMTLAAAVFGHAYAQAASAPPAAGAASQARLAKPRLDVSGHKRIGKASVYATGLRGRKLADGTRMDPQSDSAASKTLPLGTTAKVTNLATGQSAVVTIRDRGPYVKGRIVDLFPATAEQVGIDRKKGVSRVEVAPLSVLSGNDAAKQPDPVNAAGRQQDEPPSSNKSSNVRRQ